MSCRLKIDRMVPLVVSAGIDCALVLGGMKRVQRGSQIQLMPVRQAEFLDVANKQAYLAGNYRLPENVKELLGLFKID